LGIAFGAGVLLGAVIPVPEKEPSVPQPEKDVDLQRYLGKWFELARYENWFERGCEAATAEYGLLPDGKVSVRNSCRYGGVAGRLKVTSGKARILPGTGGTKLKVSFFGPFYIGNYWVLDHAEDYAWSIVGEPSGRYLWILTRDAHPAGSMQEMLVRRAGELGFDAARIRMTKHA
jgi:apolipoprotein D and lipocalin family protein